MQYEEMTVEEGGLTVKIVEYLDDVVVFYSGSKRKRFETLPVPDIPPRIPRPRLRSLIKLSLSCWEPFLPVLPAEKLP